MLFILNSLTQGSLFHVTETGLDTLTTTLRLCDPLTSLDDVTKLKDWLSETWFNLAMMDYPYPVSFMEPLPAWPIKVMHTFIVIESKELSYHGID